MGCALKTPSLKPHYLTLIMRYIPSGRYTLDEIAEQCRIAINRADEFNVTPAPLNYDEVRKFFKYEEELIAA
jgi:hypothetical protein